MTIQVLISCMHEKDKSIVQRSNIQTDCLVVNQCDIDKIEEFTFINNEGLECKVMFVNTTERGLSKSRNMAIRNAWADICLICDDDESLNTGYKDAIENAYKQNEIADLIVFPISGEKYTRKFPTEKKKLNFTEILKTSSQQISFNRKTIIDNNILFDEKMGSGTGNGPGEETMFLLSCRKLGLKMFYTPFCIALINKGESQWFKGYDAKYFQNQGWVDRRLLGPVLGFVYIFYWALFRKSEYKNDGISVSSALKNSLKGYFSKR